MTLRIPRASMLLTTSFVLAAGWFATSHASQDGVNGEFILFTTDRANPSPRGMCSDCEEIYVMSPDGNDATRLTTGGADLRAIPYNSGGADWSDSRKLIAFQSNRPLPGTTAAGAPQIYLMNLDGSDQRLLVSLPGGAAFPSFSRNGNRLCFQSQTTPRDIYTVNLNGGGLTNITSPGRLPGQPGVSGDNIRCDWSPKGNLIAFTRNEGGNQDIYVVNADGSGTPARLTDTAGADANPAWSPTGDRIAFESNRIEGGKPDIYVMNADGSGIPTRLTNFDLEPTPTLVAVTKPTWSPTGDRVAFHRRVKDADGVGGHFQIYTMNADGTDVTQITFTPTPPTPEFSGFPSWGKWTVSR